VAVVGSYFVHTEHLRWEAFALSVPVGLLAAAILLVNNIRDADTDRRAGKKTLAVRLGRDRARTLFLIAVGGAFAAVPAITAAGDLSWLTMLSWLAIPLAVPLARTVMERTDGPALNAALAKTGMLLALFSLLLSVGLVAS
jgi:1,4-dihydroxy-2-naphthoate octaprenyltransferase